MGKLFGTDGIRGIVNGGLDAELAYWVGQASALVLSQEKAAGRPLFAIGKDTRISSDMLEGALIAGLCSAGADVLHLGVVPTPAVAWIAADCKADAGIVISASHNPFEYNGIKIFNGQGYKLCDDLEAKIETIIQSRTPVPRKTHGALGRVFYTDQTQSDRYLDHLASTIEGDLSGVRILVDCANGAACSTAARLFSRFPSLRADVINTSADGVNINAGCGSTHMELLSGMVRAGRYDLGLAFDGDADRCLAVDEHGETIDGDQIMAVCGFAMRQRGKLSGNTIVATVMSNIGLHIFARENAINLICTDVGDRNVLERMKQDGFALGGEQSGHMIFSEYATTGDGQLTALQLLQILCHSGKRASELAGICRKYPQILINVPVGDQASKEAVMNSPGLMDAIKREEAALGDGRILIRPSGTEALIRIMVEAKSSADALACAERLAGQVKRYKK
jgi:phosphoglucosamine mutase